MARRRASDENRLSRALTASNHGGSQTMTFLTSIPHFGRTVALLWVGLLQPGLTATIEPSQPPVIPAGSGRTAETVVRELAARSAKWIAPPAALETLEYDFVSGSEVTRVRVKRGEPRRSRLDGRHASRRVPQLGAVSGEILDRAQARGQHRRSRSSRS